MNQLGARMRSVCTLVTVIACGAAISAHSGPPFPIVENRVAGAYVVSIWTDPDSTDDGTAGGQFWVVLGAAGGGAGVPGETRVTVGIAPIDRAGTLATAAAEPVDGAAGNQFAALVMDHEGRFLVRVSVTGPLGRADVESEVDATYDLRPAPALLFVYAAPFVLLGLLWIRLLIKRRAGLPPPA